MNSYLAQDHPSNSSINPFPKIIHLVVYISLLRVFDFHQGSPCRSVRISLIHTVDGSEIRRFHQLKLVVYPIIYWFLYIPGGCLGISKPSTVPSPISANQRKRKSVSSKCLDLEPQLGQPRLYCKNQHLRPFSLIIP